MKHTKTLAAFLFLVITTGLLQQACRKSTQNAGNVSGNSNLPGTSPPSGDTLSARLLFHAFTKKQGTIPSAPASNGSVQISIKDTLYLTDQLLRFIKFRHTDFNKNVSGAFIQIFINGSASSFYYDVPELKNMSASDSISVVTIGIDPGNLKKPQTAEIKIVPYDKNKQAIVQITRPVRIDENRVDIPPVSNCGLDTPPTMYWSWEASCRVDDVDAFLSLPGKVNSPEGQDIQGSCCNGNTRYPLDCPGDTAGIFRRKLHFATHYIINFETFQFSGSGTFLRLTEEDSPIPLPSQSNFCGSGNGVVRPNVNLTRYEGSWTVTKAVLPAKKPLWWSTHDTQQLTLRTTSSTGTGFGNPGGVIHQLDCKTGALVLVQLSREGNGADLVKFYGLRKIGENLWHQ
jgi:hypothetical protein